MHFFFIIPFEVIIETLQTVGQHRKASMSGVIFFFINRDKNLELVKGDACDVESFAAALEGKDAVLSSLGVYANIFNPTTFYTESMHAIVEGMKR